MEGLQNQLPDGAEDINYGASIVAVELERRVMTLVECNTMPIVQPTAINNGQHHDEVLEGVQLAAINDDQHHDEVLGAVQLAAINDGQHHDEVLGGVLSAAVNDGQHHNEVLEGASLDSMLMFRYYKLIP